MWARSYGRKSRALGDPDDADIEALVAHQLEACDRWAAEQGITLAPEHRISEIGSGESIAGRPRFSALLDELERHPPGDGLLIVTEVARLSRADMEEIGRIMRILRTAGVKVLAGGRLFDLSKADDEQYFIFQAANARHEVRRFSERMALKREKQLNDGEVRLGAAPWGYRWNRNTNRLEADPEAFPILQVCCREVLTTSTLALSKKYHVPQATLWTSLSNPAICGWPSIHWGPSAKDPKRYERLPRQQIRWCGRQNNTYPHACSRREFEEIQKVLAWRRTAKTVGREAWARDVVVFIDDPGPVWISCCRAGTWPNNWGHPIYERRQEKKRTSYIEREKVHEAATSALLAALTDTERLAVALGAYLARIERQQAPAGSIDPLEECRRRYQEAVDAEFDAKEPLRSALRERRLRLEEDMARLEQEARDRMRETEETSAARTLLSILPTVGRKFPAWWEDAEEKIRRRLVPAIILRVEVRCTRKGGRLRHREVERVVLQPWIEAE